MFIWQGLNILEHLKSSTTVEHRRLEALVDIMNPSRSLADYAALLCDFQAFYAPLEAQIFGHADWAALDLDIAARRKGALLERDLNSLGMVASEPYPDSFLRSSFPASLGAMYVTEGATLGGQVIGRHLQATLGLTPANGSAFFCSYGERVGPMWLEFRDFLSAQATDAAIVQTVVDGAVETFERFGDWLESQQLQRNRSERSR